MTTRAICTINNYTIHNECRLYGQKDKLSGSNSIDKLSEQFTSYATLNCNLNIAASHRNSLPVVSFVPFSFH
jgi:hypothetical protein